MPKFAELADRYLEWTTHLAPTTQDDRRSLLRAVSSERPEGALRAYFGRLPVDEIRKPLLLEWWAAEVEGKGRAAKTGRNYLDALSGVLALAVDSEVLEVNPVDGFRAVLRRRNRTQKGRAQSDPTASICPIEEPKELDETVQDTIGEIANMVAGGAKGILADQGLDFNFGRVSHIAEFDGTTSLSEPGSFGFLVIGFCLFGWVIARKSRPN